MKVLTIDIGGTHVKVLATGHRAHRKCDSNSRLTPQQMVDKAQELAKGWEYDAVSIGYPGVVRRGRPLVEPFNLGKGWTRFDFRAAFNKPVKLVNDAVMQALGSYKGGRMLFLGLGTGLGSAMIVDGAVVPMELAHLPFRKATYEDYLGVRGLEKYGKRKWQKAVVEVTALFIAAFEPDDVVLGGGNVDKLKKLPPGCRRGNNANAFRGGFRLWE